MERCPICKARLKETSICPRCTIDLSIPLSIENQAKSLCSQSVMLLGADHLGDAVQAIEQSIQLKREPLALAVQGFVRYKSMY